MSIHYKYGFRAPDTSQEGGPDTVSFVMSDETKDRMGDIITAAGWDLSNFKKNPVALYGHNNDGLPIGRWENVRIVGKQLIGTLRFAKPGTSPFIDWVRRLFEQKMLNAVSVGFREIQSEPLDPERPWLGLRFLKQELFEGSVVTVPANPNALVQRALAEIPPDIRALLVATSGRPPSAPRIKASPTAATGRPHPAQGIPKMAKLSEMIQADRDELIALNDRQTEFNVKIAEGEELSPEEGVEFDQIEGEKEAIQKRLDRRIQAEKTLGLAASARQVIIPPPLQPGGAVGPSQQMFAQAKAANEKPMDIITRLAVCNFKAHVERKSVGQVLAELYPERTDLDAVHKAATNPAATTVAGWAAELVQVATLDFLEALRPMSVYGQLSPMGVRFTFGRNGSVKIPRRNPGTGTGAAGDLRGAFVGEGQPIPVRKANLASITLTPHKMGVISTFTKEMADQSTPQIEAIIRQGILEDTALAIDTALLDAVAADAIRPAGLMNGVVPIAGTAGGGVAAMTADLGKLIGPFTTANAADRIVILINPAKVFQLQWASTAVGIYPFRDQANQGTFGGYPFIASTNVGLTDLIAVRFADFMSSTADTPEFDVSDVATIHEDDGGYPADQALRSGTTTVLPIATGAAGAAVVATPIRSLWQTASIGLRLILGMDWAMRRSGMIQKVNNITW